MSNSLAIAAVTATLHSLIFLGIREELGSGNITALPLDKARSSREGNQVNLFLYHIMPNPARRNERLARGNLSHAGKSPLALDLFYLVTIYGQNDSETKSHRLLGAVMSVLYDHTTLSRAEIEAATEVELSDSDLHRQVEQITITPEHLTFEEVSQLWRGFQAQYRVSVAYKVSVVTIDSTLLPKSALPVLSRNWDDRGFAVYPGLAPALQGIRLPHRQASAQFGDTIALDGIHLESRNLMVQFRNVRFGHTLELPPLPEQTETELQVQLPAPADAGAIAEWRAGFYSLSLAVQRPDYVWTTNELPFALAPQVLSITPQEMPQGRVLLTLTCLPQIRPEQKVILLIGDRGVSVQDLSSPADPTAPSTLTFQLKDVQPGLYVVRLRVDGVDSIPIDFASTPLQFAENQTVRVTG
jgi:Pvc16 N-terminal domain